MKALLNDKKAYKGALGYSKRGAPIELYYFPGTSDKKALIIGGVHGSELSAIEVAKKLIEQLTNNGQPFYSVIIIPALFTDNAQIAENFKRDRVLQNAGRYTDENSADPNRQMPLPGKPFFIEEPIDAEGRKIENENALLLQLIQAYEPERILNLHAIRDQSKAGIFADPRTDCKGRALGFSLDSTLALLMAQHIQQNGCSVPGNRIKTSPTALYYLDPAIAAEGDFQQRNFLGSNHSIQARGVSLGTWAATEVCDFETGYHRNAMRILTMEFPGYKKPSEYKSLEEQERYARQVEVYASAIASYFIQPVCVGQNNDSESNLVLK